MERIKVEEESGVGWEESEQSRVQKKSETHRTRKVASGLFDSFTSAPGRLISPHQPIEVRSPVGEREAEREEIENDMMV